jgi:hypothetical protein
MIAIGQYSAEVPFEFHSSHLCADSTQNVSRETFSPNGVIKLFHVKHFVNIEVRIVSRETFLLRNSELAHFQPLLHAAEFLALW